MTDGFDGRLVTEGHFSELTWVLVLGCSFGSIAPLRPRMTSDFFLSKATTLLTGGKVDTAGLFSRRFSFCLVLY